MQTLICVRAHEQKRPCIADPYLSQPGKPWPWLLPFDGNRWQDFQLQLHVEGLFTCPFLNKALHGTAQSAVLNWPTRFMNFRWTVSWFLYISESGLQWSVRNAPARVHVYARTLACMLCHVCHAQSKSSAPDWVTAASMKSYQSEVSDFCKVITSHVLPLKVFTNRTNIIGKNVLDSASWMIQYYIIHGCFIVPFQNRNIPHLLSVNRLTWFTPTDTL